MTSLYSKMIVYKLKSCRDVTNRIGALADAVNRGFEPWLG